MQTVKVRIDVRDDISRVLVCLFSVAMVHICLVSKVIIYPIDEAKRLQDTCLKQASNQSACRCMI